MSSGKGSQFERDICKFLTKWASGQQKELWFWRSPASGALSTIHGYKNVSGDIISVKTEGDFLTSLFSIECKNGYPKTFLHQHLKDIKNFGIEVFWRQAVNSSIESNKIPMLIYRKKGINVIVGITQDMFMKLNALHNSRYIMLGFTEELQLPNVVFFDLDLFFSKVTPDDVRNLVQCQS